MCYTMFMKTFHQKFIQCGVTGLCLEVAYTGLIARFHKDKRMMGKSSILMFPIYGTAALFLPLYKLIKGWNVLFRGLFYMICIFTGEYVSGKLLTKREMCPWDYTDSPLNIEGVIRLDFAPLWFFTGLLFEKILKK